MRLQGAFDLSRCTPHERHDRTFVARRTHRNGEPPFGTHEHKDHPNLRQNHRPEDKPRHGNPVAQVGGYGKEHLQDDTIMTVSRIFPRSSFEVSTDSIESEKVRRLCRFGLNTL